MIINKADWQKLQMPLLMLGSILVLVGILINFAQQYSTRYDLALKNQQNLLNQARQKFESSGLEKQTIIEYLPRYNGLIANGFIGEEQRIEWIERLRKLHRDYKLFSIDYSIGTQEHYQPKFIPSISHFVMQRSIMQLNLEMLHEGDLINLMNGLQENTSPFLVRDCEITRVNRAEINSQNILPNLKAACEIDWLTLRDPQLTPQFSGVLQ